MFFLLFDPIDGGRDLKDTHFVRFSSFLPMWIPFGGERFLFVAV